MKHILRNGIILDGTQDMQPIEGKAILVADGRIVCIVPEDRTVGGYEPVDLEGAYVLPGLIDLHVHLALSGKPPKSADKPVDYTKLYQLLTGNPIVRAAAMETVAGYARTMLMSGVTTIRTVGGVLNFDAVVRDDIESGKRVGPRIVAGNMGISVPGGHFAGSIATEASSPEEAAEHVRQIAAANPDLIKLMITGGVMDSSDEGEPGVLRMPPEIVKAASDEAHRLGFVVAAHVESTEGMRVALQNGVDTIEHGAQLDDELVSLFKERGAAYVCTCSPFVPYAEFELEESHAAPFAKVNGRIVRDGVVNGAKRCLAEGIPVGIGNDVGCPFVTHYDFWRELCFFHKYVEASTQETLHLATLGNARILGLDDFVGSIERGKSADLIVVRDNPLDDLAALRNVQMVMTRGKLIRDPRVKRMREIDQLLDRYM